MEEICSHSALQREEKRQQLRVLRMTIQERNTELMPDWAIGYHIMLEQKRLSPLHGEHLWEAAWQDTEKDKYLTMEEVLNYARMAAAPVGRAVMEIAGEKEVDRAALDSFCMALLLIDHLQNARGDYLLRNRTYLPQHWLEEAGISDKVLTKKETGPRLRKVFNDWLEEVEKQLQRAHFLPVSLQNKKLKSELKFILATRRALVKKIAKTDPMTHKITLTPWEEFRVGLGALFR
jgi:phytoene/squalene synthetase